MSLEAAHEVLRRQFGFEAFRPGQAEVISHLLAGRSAAAVFPTGGGKSLCFQVPALLLPGLTIVVSPLIALMKDQIDALTRRGIAADRLDSTQTAEEFSSVTQAIRGGRLRLLYVAPERFQSERFRGMLQHTRVSLFAVDEAHCISEWGHAFRPDYLKLVRYSKAFGAERVLALTATATPAVLEDICREFGIEAGCAVRTGFYRPNLTLRTTPVADAKRDALLRQRLGDSPPGATIVYVTLQRTAETVAKNLAAAGFAAKAYHAGLEGADRAAVQDWFLTSKAPIVVCTIAFGMGIDKPDVRYIYHYNLPKSLENYSQEVGRAGRDGLASHCEMFVCPDDLNALENFAYGDTASIDAVRGFVDEMFSLGDEFDVSLYEMSVRHDIRSLVLETLSTYLELDGYIQPRAPYYSRYRFQPLVPSAEILARFEGERRDLLAAMFRQAQKAKTWFHIDLEAAARQIGSRRDRLLKALDYLAEKKLMEVKAEGLRHRFQRLRRDHDAGQVAESLHRRLVAREASELARLRQVLELAAHKGCQTARLAEHFGERLGKRCGHCGGCLDGGRPARLLARGAPAINQAVWRQASALRQQEADALSDPRSFARFVCGLSSPRLRAAKLTSNPLYGALAAVPFPQVLEAARLNGSNTRTVAACAV
ncbi:MAG: ATP-dependent DNA helicase RecQ [Pirellulales bacterium]